MTTTDLLSSQSIGTSTNIGDKKFPVKTTAQAGTTAYSINAKLTLGSGIPLSASNNITVWYTSSSFSLTAAEAAAQLDTAPARYVRLPLSPNPSTHGLVTYANSFIEPLQGAYIYIWFELPNLTTAATLDVKLVEI